MLRKILLLLVAVVVAVALPVGASADHSLFDYQSAVDSLLSVDPTIEPAANDGGKDFAVGGFQGSVENNNIGFSGNSGPLGESPHGHLSETIPGAGAGTFQARWRVICVAVVGQSAALGLVPTDTASNDQQDPFILAVFDGGPGGALDAFGFVPEEVFPPDMCALAIGDAVFPLQHGNILVHDALP